MKALSLTQGWATAFALGVKEYETRSWQTAYCGELCIHASKSFPVWAREFCIEQRSNKLPHVQDLPLGVIVAVAELTSCRQTETLVQGLEPGELSWGDYSEGRYAFHLENVRPLVNPVPCKGALSLWTVPRDVENQILEQLASIKSGIKSEDRGSYV